MLIPSHTLRRGSTTAWWLLAAVFSVLLAPLALGQAEQATAASKHAIAVGVSRWFATGGGDQPNWADQSITAARVEVRFERDLVGEGQACGEGCVGNAAAQAIDGLRAHARGLVSGLGPSLAVSVELAGDWIPLTAAELASPDLMLRRGIDSVAVLAGEQTRVTFASAFHGVSPITKSFRQELSNLAASGLGDTFAAAVGPAELAEQRGVRFYRFEAEHWAQLEPGGMLVRLQRGAHIATPHRVMRPEMLAGLAEQLTVHLVQRSSHEDASNRCRAIDLLTCEPDGDDASPLARATVLMALERAAMAGVMPDEALAAADVRWMEFAADEARLMPQVAGMLAMADVREQMPRALRARVDASLHSVMDQLETIPWSGTPSEAIGLWALAAEHADSSEARARIGRALGEVISAKGMEGMVSLLPWSAWADSALHEGEAMQSQAALRELRRVMWTNQFQASDAVRGSEDFVGGLVFATGGMPSSASIRPMVFAAWALGDSRLTNRQEAMGSADQRGELLRVLSGLGFIRALTVDEASAYRSTLPASVVGGVRRTLWDSQVHAEDTALALLACLETLESLGDIPAE